MYTREQVSIHNTKEDLWIIIDTDVYDLTKFIGLHPGGIHVLLEFAGKDATDAFYSLHRHSVLDKYARLKIGSIQGEQRVIEPPGLVSKVPFAEPMWLLPQYKSVYYSESHYRLQREMRVFVDTHVTKEAQQGELTGTRPSKDLYKRLWFNSLTK